MYPLPFSLFSFCFACSRCYLDMAKVLVFRYLYWFVLSVVFVTGATRISVFGLGYLLACFFFFLFGTQLLVKPARTRLAVWDCLIIYNIAVIIAKNMLSVSEAHEPDYLKLFLICLILYFFWYGPITANKLYKS